MKINEVLRVDKGEIVAIVGAGGKTNLLFTLAETLPKPVCLTTTTKIMHGEGQGIAEHILFSDFSRDPEKIFKRQEIILVTNSLNESSQKWHGLSDIQANGLIFSCRQRKVTCLIEADGARHLPLKAPAEWEPVIPLLVDLVIVVVGLSALGESLDPETVFRPEIFSQLTGLPVGGTIRMEQVLKMLSHPEGGLKGIPSNSRASVVFNQADAYHLKDHELDLIRERLQADYSSVIVTSLRSDPTKCEVIFHNQ